MLINVFWKNDENMKKFTQKFKTAAEQIKKRCFQDLVRQTVVSIIIMSN